MQDQNTQNATQDTSAPDPMKALENATAKAAQGDFVQKIVTKIKSSENILIALAQNPSVDEIAAAIGLALYLDGIQKHTTAVYSGRVPESLVFLRPEATFETDTASLQDFIISLNKDKADHLRYKLEGDNVKVFITPYKTTISEEDLTFSHGDYNVDFVIAMNVPAAGNLDPALKEHARIMRDASIVDITTNAPGRFGEVEWSDPMASSVSEMVTELVFALQGNDETLDQDVATALLTGIVAATARFSNERTSSETLSIASKLMSMGADQQLISSNVGENEVIENENEYGAPVSYGNNMYGNSVEDRTQLEVQHDELEETESAGNMAPQQAADVVRPGMGMPGMMNVPGVAGAPGVPEVNTVPNAANGMPGAGVVGNPAAQAAPEMANTNEAVAPVDGTNAVAPENVVVQPVIPGAVNAGAANGAAEAGAVNAENPGELKLSVAPVEPAAPKRLPDDPGTMSLPGAAPQVGVALQPPAPKPQTTKNYAEMMEQALAEGNEAPEQVKGAGRIPVPDAVMPPVNAPEMSVPGNGPVAGAPIASSAVPTAPAAETPVAEPVVKPADTILPPPPAPSAEGMMPPVLPPVQQ